MAGDSPETASRGHVIGLERIMALLPHRYPFLLIDGIIDADGAGSGTGIKGVTVNEPFFPGHFPGHPVMPGVLIVEAMAQTAAALAMDSLAAGREAPRALVYFREVRAAKFRKPVHPGVQLRLPVRLIGRRRDLWTFAGQAMVDDVIHASAEFSAVMAAAGA